MKHIDADLKERHRFIDSVTSGAHDFFDETRAEVDLYGQRFSLSKELARVVIPNIIDGRVALPRDIADSDYSLPVIAVRNGEQYSLGKEFAEQLPRQAQETRRVVMSWQPATEDKADSFLGLFEEHRATHGEHTPPISISEGASASVAALSHVFDIERIAPDFKNAPAGRLGKILLRPLLKIRMGSDVASQIYTVAHELVHVIQKRENPVKTYKSQRNADMQMLRDELVAYHVGAMTSLRLRGLNDIHQVEEIQDHQMAIEIVRAYYNGGNSDPFSPSGAILEKASEFGTVIHERLPYAEIVERFDEFNAENPITQE